MTKITASTAILDDPSPLTSGEPLDELEVVDLDSDTAACLAWSGTAWHSGRVGPAIRWAMLAASHAPEDGDALLAMVVMYAALGRLDEAESHAAALSTLGVALGGHGDGPDMPGPRPARRCGAGRDHRAVRARAATVSVAAAATATGAPPARPRQPFPLAGHRACCSLASTSQAVSMVNHRWSSVRSLNQR